LEGIAVEAVRHSRPLPPPRIQGPRCCCACSKLSQRYTFNNAHPPARNARQRPRSRCVPAPTPLRLRSWRASRRNAVLGLVLSRDISTKIPAGFAVSQVYYNILLILLCGSLKFLSLTQSCSCKSFGFFGEDHHGTPGRWLKIWLLRIRGWRRISAETW